MPNWCSLKNRLTSSVTKSACIVKDYGLNCVYLLLSAKSRAMEKKLVQVIKEEDEVMMEN